MCIRDSGGTPFDLILSDIMMPGVDGFEFAKTVRELNQEIPILFMTARDDFASCLLYTSQDPGAADPTHALPLRG